MIKRLDAIPRVTDTDTDDPIWFPLQHHFQLTAFGLNVFVAREDGDELVGAHDETGSGQEEVYLVISGRARVFLGEETTDVEAVSVIALPDPGVRRRVVALEPHTTLVAIGGRPAGSFSSTWRASHFDDVPRATDGR